jgi:hypothetical protein
MSFIAELSRRNKPKHLRETLFAYSFDFLRFRSRCSSRSTLRFDGVFRADYSHAMWVAVAGRILQRSP